MISSAQMRAARALLGIDQKQLATLAGVSVPSTLTKIIEALDAAGIELIGNDHPSQGRGRGVRLKEPQ
jgi:transcriptional regulator with XRE-family HTH domain